MKLETLLAFLEWFIPKWLPIDTGIKRIPKLGSYLGSVISVLVLFRDRPEPGSKTCMGHHGYL